ncbi:hypothetical protein [Saccharopolyspora sp. NPDC002686]|uniref:hypothetical protein n=1 Tax=Saccharopolyspora sp. NPDC002686 TaxID=3154541 RepID=UPI003321BEBA
MAKSKPNPQQKADRALCPVPVSNVLQLKVHEVARAMRAAGATQQLTVGQAKTWKASPETAPEWFVALLAERTCRDAERIARAERHALEHEHRMLLLREKVERRLLAGAKHFRSDDAELVATDIAVQASKELVRNCGPVCGGPVDSLLPVEAAALRWAGVDPGDHSTWVIHRGDCEG